jgi:RND family efflux transporter MFP subunit
MNRGTLLLRWARWGGRAAVLLGFTAGVVLLMLWLGGRFTAKVPGGTAAAQSHVPDVEGRVAAVRLERWPLSESAVGTIRAVHETSIGSKLLARVVEVNLKAGQKVRSGDVLLRLDDTDLRAKLQQVKAAVTSIEAARSQAAADAKRGEKLVGSGAVSQQELERARTAVRSAEADLLRAQETVNEVQAMLDWATIRSPIDGTVIDKKVDVGDMVTPGQMLVTLFDPTRMQLVASVRESLTRRLQVGQTIGVKVDVLDKLCSGTVSEIVPEAQSASRAFQVKVTGPCPPGVYTGMFGHIVIPLQEEEVLVIPARAVQNIGQLQLVDVAQDGRVSRRSVRTGRTRGEDVEVLSGLREGEQVVPPR